MCPTTSRRFRAALSAPTPRAISGFEPRPWCRGNRSTTSSIDAASSSDRVQLPPFRTIAGFAPGIVYMAVKDSTGVVHLERARVK